jgi:hypothetical protein
MKSQKVTQYISNLNSGFTKSRTQLVLNKIHNNHSSNIYDLRKERFSIINPQTHQSESVYISHQTLTSAISNLMDLGIVEISGKIEIQKKHYSLFKVTTDPSRIQRNAEKRKNDKIVAWLKNGIDYELPPTLTSHLQQYKNQLETQNNQLNLF